MVKTIVTINGSAAALQSKNRNQQTIDSLLIFFALFQ